MGRRRRAGRTSGRAGDAAGPADVAALVGAGRLAPTERPVSAAERAWRLVIVATRNAVGIVGLLFFGWSAASLVVLYFVDTLAGMGAAFAALGFKLSHVDPRRGFWALAEGVLTGLTVAGILVAIVAIPLGMPLVFLLGARGAWREVRADPALLGAIGVIALTGLVGAIRHVFALAEGRAGEASVRQAFAILMTRWVLVLIAIYTLGVPLGRFGLIVVVLAYAAVSAWSELEPERFARLIPDHRPPEPG
jgi:hypothetical protein